MDKSTLKERLKALANEISRESDDPNQGRPTAGPQGGSGSGSGNNAQGNGRTGSGPGMGGPGSGSGQHQNQPPVGPRGGHGHGDNTQGNGRPGNGPGIGPPGPGSGQHQNQNQPQSMSSYNNIQSHQTQTQRQAQRGGNELLNLGNVHRDTTTGANNSNNASSRMPTPPLKSSESNSTKIRHGSTSSSRSISSSTSRSISSSTSQNQKPNNQESRDRLRKQQQRLLLLHHSSKCQVADGTCKIMKYCPEMKQLWFHMTTCGDVQCTVQHCYSSRTILSHYRKCKDQGCLLCGPVRNYVQTVKVDRTPSSSSSAQGDRIRSGQIPPLPPLQGAPQVPPPVVGSGKSMPPYQPTSGPPISNQYVSPELGQYPSHQPASYGQAHVPPLPPSNHSSMQPMPPPIYRTDNQNSAPQAVQSAMRSDGPPRNTDWRENDERKKQKLRLLLLRHASKCTAEEGKCKETPHCQTMKRLWRHVTNCANVDCIVAHCTSSRSVIMHYRNCKDTNCSVCPPRKNKRKFDDEPPVGQTSDVGPGAGVSPITKKPKPPEKKIEGTTTLLKSLTVNQIELHIQSLRRTTQLSPKVLKDRCLVVLKVLMNHDDGWVFNSPVDPVALGVPDYFERIKKPMDLGTINKRLESGLYSDIIDFDGDVRLTFDNAMLYNEPHAPVHEMAKMLKALYVEHHTKLVDTLKTEGDGHVLNDRACGFCGFETLQFEPPVIFCSGISCQSKRIHRNRHFYVSGNKQYNWCTSCYNELDDSPIHLQDVTLTKDELAKKKNEEINAENWVQCDDCDRWLHQICGLFNPRQNTHDDSVKYTCPHCLLKAKKLSKKPPDDKNLIAEDLPRTKLSEYLENHVLKKIDQKYKDLAKEKAKADVRRSLSLLFAFRVCCTILTSIPSSNSIFLLPGH